MNQGEAEAQFNLGKKYYMKALPKTRARRCAGGAWRRSRDTQLILGHVDGNAKEARQRCAGISHGGGSGMQAQTNLGWAYDKGEGAKDQQKAVRWWRMAAEQGYAKAQNNFPLDYDQRRCQRPEQGGGALVSHGGRAGICGCAI